MVKNTIPYMGRPRSRVEAKAQAQYWVKTLPEGFRIKVWENLGWHWCLDNIVISIKAHWGIGNLLSFWAMVTDNPEHLGSGSFDYQDPKHKHHDTALKCLSSTAKRAKEQARELQERHRLVGDFMESMLAQTKPKKIGSTLKRRVSG